MVIDVHVHSLGSESIDQIVRGMDEAGLEKVVIFSPYPAAIPTNRIFPRVRPGIVRHLEFTYPEVDSEKQRRAIEFVSRLQREAPDRIIAFVFLEPRLKNAVEILEWAVTSKEIRGVKMIPDHWYPYDEFLYPIYRKIEELGVPVIFHCGIEFEFKDSSRFAKPVNYEVLINFPRLRFALAHICWPWVDECIAVWGRFRAALDEIEGMGNEVQMYIDITPGTPLMYRKEVLQKLLAYGAEDYILFGTDCLAENLGECGKKHIERDKTILEQLIGAHRETIEKIMHRNATRFLKLI